MSPKRTIALVAIVQATTLAATAHAQPINRTLDAPAAGHVVVALVDGDVTVRGWDRPTVEISGRLGASAQELEVGQQGNETRIRVIERPGDVADAPDLETELFVSVPAGSSLAIDGTNADLLVAEVRGTLSLHTVAGDIEAEFFGTSVTAETVGGDIRVSARGAPGEATLTTVAGEIEAAGPFRAITASTVSGDIELDVLDAAMLRLNSTNGDIEVHATFDGAAELTAETINGDVELRVGEEDELNLDAGTFSGRIETCFDTAPDAPADGGSRGRRGGRGSGGQLTLAADAGSPTVRVRTLNGDIELCGS